MIPHWIAAKGSLIESAERHRSNDETAQIWGRLFSGARGWDVVELDRRVETY